MLRTAALIVFVAVVGTTFWGAARATGGISSQERQRLPGQLAHSLIPIVVGYIFAHYLSYLVERGQEAVVRLADPFGLGWRLSGLAPDVVSYTLSRHPSVLWTIKVACVVVGHMVAVVSAHDRALRLLPKQHQITGQVAMMLTMVGFRSPVSTFCSEADNRLPKFLCVLLSCVVDCEGRQVRWDRSRRSTVADSCRGIPPQCCFELNWPSSGQRSRQESEGGGEPIQWGDLVPGFAAMLPVLYRHR